MICTQRIASIQRPLKLLAFFISGVSASALVLWVGLVFGTVNEMDFKNAQRIESEKAHMCAKTPGIADCPKTNHWRN